MSRMLAIFFLTTLAVFEGVIGVSFTSRISLFGFLSRTQVGDITDWSGNGFRSRYSWAGLPFFDNKFVDLSLIAFGNTYKAMMQVT